MPGSSSWWQAAIATVIALLGGVGMLATLSWWFTSVSPAVLDAHGNVGKLRTAVDKRLTRLDNPEIGTCRSPRKAPQGGRGASQTLGARGGAAALVVRTRKSDGAVAHQSDVPVPPRA